MISIANGTDRKVELTREVDCAEHLSTRMGSMSRPNYLSRSLLPLVDSRRML